MSDVKRYTDRLEALKTDRVFYENDWTNVNRLALISNKWFMDQNTTTELSLNRIQAIRQHRRALYDTTAVYALDRLSAALVSLLVPSGVKWHSLGLAGQESEDNEEVTRWLERITNFLFDTRYTPASGWDSAIPKIMKSMAGFSVGVLFVEEGMGDATPINYRMIPLQEVYLGVNDLGQYDTAYRSFTLTAEQALAKFNEDDDVLSSRITEAAGNPNKKQDRFTFLHVVELREVGKEFNSDSTNSKWTNHYVDISNNILVREGGYFSFPYVPFWWEKDTHESYGTSPMIKALSEVAGLNAMGKSELTMYEQQANPPYATKAKGKYKRLDFRPGANNTFVEWRDGRALAQPLLDGRNVNFAEAIKQARTGQVEKLLFINLFQILVDDKSQTATEALIRKKEKAEMLAPIGNSVRQSLSALIDREIDILKRRGLFSGEFEQFSPPESLPDNSDIQPIFVSPLDKARDIEEVEGTQQAYAVTQQLVAATGDPSAWDWFDTEKDSKRVAAIVGHPLNNLRTSEEVAVIRAQREQQLLMQQRAAMAQPLASAAKDGSEALLNMQEAGVGGQ